MNATIRILSIPALILAACPGCSASESVPAEQLDLCGYEIAFADEFDDLAIAPRKLEGGARWTAHTPWNGDFGDAMFSDPRPGWPFTTGCSGLRRGATPPVAGGPA
jgi:hypothetical protein